MNDYEYRPGGNDGEKNINSEVDRLSKELSEMKEMFAKMFDEKKEREQNHGKHGNHEKEHGSDDDGRAADWQEFGERMGGYGQQLSEHIQGKFGKGVYVHNTRAPRPPRPPRPPKPPKPPKSKSKPPKGDWFIGIDFDKIGETVRGAIDGSLKVVDETLRDLNLNLNLNKEEELSFEDILPSLYSADVEKVLSAIGSRQKLDILMALLHAPMTVNELVAFLALNSTGQVYHHLNALISVGIVTQEDDYDRKGVYAVSHGHAKGLALIFTGVREMLKTKDGDDSWEYEEETEQKRDPREN